VPHRSIRSPRFVAISLSFHLNVEATWADQRSRRFHPQLPRGFRLNGASA
jgi:hypothetical protein